MSATLTFDETAAQSILEEFGRDIDDEGYVMNPETGKRITNEDGIEIHKDHFAGVERGSVIILDDDFNTLVDHVKRRKGD